MRAVIQARLGLGVPWVAAGAKPKSPSEGGPTLPEDAVRAMSSVCLPLSVSVTFETFVGSPSDEMETS